MRYGQDAEAEGEPRLVIHADSFIGPGRRWSRQHLRRRLPVAYR
jgi:hypothetical protein